MRNDNITCLAYIGTGTGLTPPEQYTAHWPDTPTSELAIAVDSTVILKNMHTGLWCRLVPVPAGHLLHSPKISTMSATVKALPSSCATFGMVADQATTSTATVFTYTGAGCASHAAGPLQNITATYAVGIICG
jgi:hypothetical protein